MFSSPGRFRGGPVTPMVSHDGPRLTPQSRHINRGACWGTSRATMTYLRSSATDDELSDMRYPAQGFRTFRSVREVRL